MLSWFMQLFELSPKITVSPGLAPEWTVTDYPDCKILSGFFFVFSTDGAILLQVEGKLVVFPNKPVDVFARNLPASIRKHKHGSCFQLHKPGFDWFKLHWDKPAMWPDDARSHVEGILAECL